MNEENKNLNNDVEEKMDACDCTHDSCCRCEQAAENKFDRLVGHVAEKVGDAIEAGKTVADEAVEIAKDFRTSETYANMRETVVESAGKAGGFIGNIRESLRRAGKEFVDGMKGKED